MCFLSPCVFWNSLLVQNFSNEFLRMIPFNKPYLAGNELSYIKKAVESGKISGNGYYTKKCHEYFENKHQFKKVLLTSSGTDALEMAAILANLKEGDEVIMPSFTFVSTANAFVLRGAKIIFADSRNDEPNLDIERIEDLITNKTKAIIAVHYAGVSCNMDLLLKIANKHKLFVIEDAAHAISSTYKGRQLGSFGHLAAFSFHETKNIMCGEGGMIVINDNSLIERAEIIWEKGTNRSAFWRGEVDKYGWMDIGSSFLPSEITAAFLYAQLENLERIQTKRISLWECYLNNLKVLQNKGYIKLPKIHNWASNNAHMFYILCNNSEDRDSLIQYLKDKDIMTVFHYSSLHKSKYYNTRHDGRHLKNSDRYSDILLRLPLYFELELNQVQNICRNVEEFFREKERREFT